MLGLVAGLAVRLVVLVQTSSASVEPVFVFSQVKIIVDTIGIGELTLESTLETRLMQRVNDYGP